DGVNGVHALLDTTEGRVPAREVRRVAEHEVELRAVGVRAGVRHADHTGLEGRGVQLVGDTVAGTAAAGAGGIAALGDEAGDDAMERRAVVEALTREEDEVVDGR